MISGNIGYINKGISEFTIPCYAGKRYKSEVPDTLDIYDMAKYCINAMTRSLDPEADFEMYMRVGLRFNPPVMWHSISDICTMKFMEALPLMRIITGSADNMEVDKTWMEVLLHQLGDDGNLYMPKKGRPWAFDNYFKNVAGVADSIKMNDHHLIPVYTGRILSAASIYYLRSGDGLWKDVIIKIVDGLEKLSVNRGDHAYYSPSCMYAIQGRTFDHGTRSRLWGAETREISLGLIHAYRAIGYEPALILSGKLIRYILDVVKEINDDGSFAPDNPALHPLSAHFHEHTAVLQSVLEYGMITGSEEYITLADMGYGYGRQTGNTVMGYFPEFAGSSEFEECELCCVADMIALAVKLCMCGKGDYWDDIDRWTRNMLAEGQLTPDKKAGLERYVKGLPHIVMTDTEAMKGIDTGHCTIEDVLGRNVGAFAGWAKPNEFFADDYEIQRGITGIMHCCTGNAARAIYYIWKNMVEYKEGSSKINLLLNHTSETADISSCLPYSGRAVIRIKKDCDSLYLRIPEWTEHGDIACTADDICVTPGRSGRYLVFDRVMKGSIVTADFPVYERMEDLWIEKHKYRATLRGNDIIDIDPPGRSVPLFDRKHYGTKIVPYKIKERFETYEDLYI